MFLHQVPLLPDVEVQVPNGAIVPGSTQRSQKARMLAQRIYGNKRPTLDLDQKQTGWLLTSGKTCYIMLLDRSIASITNRLSRNDEVVRQLKGT